jgi:hypothetical protein
VSWLRALIKRDADAAPHGLTLEYAHRAVKRRANAARLAEAKLAAPETKKPAEAARANPETARAKLNAINKIIRCPSRAAAQSEAEVMQ